MAFVKAVKGNSIGLALTFLTTLAGLSSTAPALADPGFAPDGDHDVIVLPDCDLAVRYNSKTFVPVKAETTLDAPSFFLKEKPLRAFKIFEDYASAGMKAAPETIIIEGYDVGKIGAFGTARFNKTFMANNRVREVQFNNERVGKETGLSDTSFIGITAVKSFEVASKNGETPYYLHVFQTPSHLTCFARMMRSTSREYDYDPAVIVTQLRLSNTANCVGNITLPDTVPATAVAPVVVPVAVPVAAPVVVPEETTTTMTRTTIIKY